MKYNIEPKKTEYTQNLFLYSLKRIWDVIRVVQKEQQVVKFIQSVSYICKTNFHDNKLSLLYYEID